MVKPLSVRNPTSKEIREYSSGLSQLLEVIQPIQVIAVGRKAQEALSSIKVKAIYARHPSMGGAAEFKNKMNEFLGT
jgi:uracil-DNA glycosylase